MTRRARSVPRHGAALVAVSVLAGCTAVPCDAYAAGEAALAAGSLVEALRGFDAVPVTDLRYREARLFAAALERRLRRHKEMLLLGLRMRGEWRDEEALEVFEDALLQWPRHQETLDLIDATRERLRVLASLRERLGPVLAGGAVQGAVGSARPAEGTEGSAGGQEPAPPGAGPEVAEDPEEPRPGPSPPTVAAVPEGPAVLPPANPPTRSVPGDPVAVQLARLEVRRSAGQLEEVLGEMETLHRGHPADARVTTRLSRLLEQRGLMRYGDGDVTSAIRDWQRALDLDPGLRSARALFDLAIAELAQPQPRPQR